MTASATGAAFQLCPDHIVHNIIPGLAAGWLRQWERSFLPKETTAAEGLDRASNLEPYDCQADALAVCYCLPLTYIKYTYVLMINFTNKTLSETYSKWQDWQK